MTFECVHCHRNPAGFWVYHRGSAPQGVRRPWCLACIDATLDRARYDIIPMQRRSHGHD